MSPRDRIVTVTTLRDTVENVEWFARRNLASGVDHMVVFLDQDQPDVQELLEATQHVTVVPTAGRYWRGARPARVSDRLSANADLVNAVACVLPSVRWLFHLDCDETLLFDRDALLDLRHDAVRFPTLEVVAEREPRPRDALRFKKVPDETQLLALSAMGAVEEPHLLSYLRGHAVGRSGHVPDLDVRTDVHVAYRDGQKLDAAVPPGCHLLHYDSWCVRDLAERWADFTPRRAARSTHRESRKQLALAAYAIQHHEALDDAQVEEYLGRLFDRLVADDVEALRRLDLLLEPPALDATPRGLPGREVRDLRRLLRRFRTRPKDAFGRDAAPGSAAEALLAVADEVGDDGLAERVRRAVRDHRDRTAGEPR